MSNNEDLHLYYLSFAQEAEDDREAKWLGGIYLLADDPMDAVKRAWDLGQNPGGQVAIVQAPPEFLNKIRSGYMSRLLTLEELRMATPDPRLRRIDGEEV